MLDIDLSWLARGNEIIINWKLKLIFCSCWREREERVGLLKWVDSLFDSVYVLKEFRDEEKGMMMDWKIKIIKFKKINETTNALDIRYK